MAYVWDHAPEQASAGDMLVALVLADHADRGGESAFPSLASLATAARLTERQVRRVLRRLESYGLIAVQRPATRRLPTMYCFPGFREDANVPPHREEGGHLEQSGGTFETKRGDIYDTHIYTELEPSEEPSEEPPPLPPKRGEYTAAFEAFWAKYPRVLNSSKKKAAQVWERMKPEKRALAMAGLDKYLTSDGWQRGFAPHTTTYLRGELWDSDPPPARMNGHPPPKPEERRASIPRLEEVLQPAKQLSDEKRAELAAIFAERRQGR